jgi:hypothetical protein
VCAGDRLKLPHAPALPQLAVQFTPRLLGSPVTVAARVACDPAVMVAEGGVEIVITIGAVVMMLAVEIAETAGLVVDAAVMVTLPPGGTAEGP